VEWEARDLVKGVPEEGEAAETSRVDAVEKIVPGDNEQTERHEGTDGQMDERGEEDHAEAEHPEDQEENERALQPNLEKPQEADDGDF